MPLDLLGWYHKLGLPINEGYSMTENLSVSHLTVPGRNQEGTVRPPNDDVEARIDPHTGEIQMRSGAMMTGYYKQPEHTRDAFTDNGWLRSCDKGQIDAEGPPRIVGRIKDLFRTSKGKCVAPAPIEDLLVMHDSIEACVVTGANLARPLGIAMLNAETITRLGEPRQRSDLEASLCRHLEQINASLDPHEQLDRLIVVTTPWTVESVLIASTFKVKRNRIEDLYSSNYVAWEASGRKLIWLDATTF